MSASKAWKKYVGFSWPTLLLGVLVICGYIISCILAVTGKISLFVAFILNTILLYLAFTPMHEAAHGNIHGGKRGWRWLNSVVGWSCASLFLTPYPFFRTIHLRHHSHTNDPHKDPDYWVVGKSWYTIALRCASIIGHYYWNFFTAIYGEMAKAKRNFNNFVALFFYFFLVFSVIYLGYIREILFLSLLPTLIASGVLAFVFDWLPHHPHTQQQRFLDTKVLLFPGLNFLLLGQNYHLIHHLYPAIPFYKYKKCFKDVRQELEANNALIVGMKAKKIRV